MRITPRMVIGGVDVSRYLLSVHAEMTANLEKDPGKFDVKLANVGGRFYGAFGAGISDEDEEQAAPFTGISDTYTELDTVDLDPKTEIEFSIQVLYVNCKQMVQVKTWQIFKGEVQSANCDEIYCTINGSCFQGNMSSGLNQDHTYPSYPPISKVVNDLLDDIGFTGTRHIFPKKNNFEDNCPELRAKMDFDTAMNQLTMQAQSIYFWDQNNEFWFVPAFTLQGSADLTGHILLGSAAKNMVGHCNDVIVIGGSSVHPSSHFSVIKTHKQVIWEAKNQEDIDEYGRMLAPITYVPNCDVQECKKIAKNLLEWYLQFKDCPVVTVSSMAPPLLCKVSYEPWNGNPPNINCAGAQSATLDPIVGIVTKRVVDLDANDGFKCQLDVATNWQTLGDAVDLGIENDNSVNIPSDLVPPSNISIVAREISSALD